MRVLVFGGTGMLGHQVLRALKGRHECWAATRSPSAASGWSPGEARVVGGVDVADEVAVTRVLDAAQPDLVVNCVGLVKQDPGCRDPGRLKRTLSGLIASGESCDASGSYTSARIAFSRGSYN
jgi:dTDP-4-dehydrorhamnose reductase